MRFFFDPDEPAAAGTQLRATPTYVEIAHATTEAPFGTSYLYVAAGSIPHSALILACLGDDLLPWKQLMEDPRSGADWQAALGRSYPFVAGLWDNAREGRLGDPALDVYVDPDVVRQRWCVAMTVGNVLVPDDAGTAELTAFLSQERMRAAYATLLHAAFSLAEDVATRSIPRSELILLFGKEFVRGQLEVLDTASKWAPKLQSIFGA